MNRKVLVSLRGETSLLNTFCKSEYPVNLNVTGILCINERDFHVASSLVFVRMTDSTSVILTGNLENLNWAKY